MSEMSSVRQKKSEVGMGSTESWNGSLAFSLNEKRCYGEGRDRGSGQVSPGIPAQGRTVETSFADHKVSQKAGVEALLHGVRQIGLSIAE